MSPHPLRHREPDAVELMDDPTCDDAALMRTYEQFRAVNRLVAGWRRTYRERIRPRFDRDSHTLLDIGTGGGDIVRAIARWAAADGVRVDATGIDPDQRAHSVALRTEGGIVWRRSVSSELADAGERFDFVISNHLLHHLDAEWLGRLLADSKRLARRAVIHSDIRRSATAYALFWAMTAPLALVPDDRRSFIRPDGLASIRRSFTLDELRHAVPAGWSVSPQSPHRLLLTLER